MKHYDEYGMPTPEHEELMRKSMQIAEDAVNERAEGGLNDAP